MAKFEKWEFLLQIVGTGNNRKEAFEDAIENTVVEEFIDYECNGQLIEFIDEDGYEIEEK